jgi:hypothetical protein
MTTSTDWHIIETTAVFKIVSHEDLAILDESTYVLISTHSSRIDAMSTFSRIVSDELDSVEEKIKLQRGEPEQ